MERKVRDASSGKQSNVQSRGPSRTSRDRSKRGSKVSTENTKHVPGENSRSHKAHKSPDKDLTRKTNSDRSATNKEKKSEEKKSHSGKRDNSNKKEDSNQAKSRSSSRAPAKIVEKQRNSSKTVSNKMDAENQPTVLKNISQKPTSRKQSRQNSSKPRSKSPTRTLKEKASGKNSNGNSQNKKSPSQIRELPANSLHSKPLSKPTSFKNSDSSPVSKKSAGIHGGDNLSNLSQPRHNQPVDHHVQENTRVRTFEIDVDQGENSMAGLKSQDRLVSDKNITVPVFESAKQVADRRGLGQTQDLVNQLNELIDEVANKEVEIVRRSSSLEKQREQRMIDVDSPYPEKKIDTQNSGFFTYSNNRDPVNHEMKVVRIVTEVPNQFIEERIPLRTEIIESNIGTKSPSISDSFLIN